MGLAPVPAPDRPRCHIAGHVVAISAVNQDSRYHQRANGHERDCQLHHVSRLFALCLDLAYLVGHGTG